MSKTTPQVDDALSADEMLAAIAGEDVQVTIEHIRRVFDEASAGRMSVREYAAHLAQRTAK